MRIAPDGASVGRDGRGVPHGGVAIKGQTAPRSTRGGRVVDQGVCVPESPRGVLGTTPADTGDWSGGVMTGAHSQDPGPDKLDESPVSSFDVLTDTAGVVLKCDENKLLGFESSLMIGEEKWRPL